MENDKRDDLKSCSQYVFEIVLYICFCSVAKMCVTLQPHEVQQARLSCPSLSPGVCSNSCPLSQWWHPTISSSVTSFSSCSQSFPTSGFFPMSQLFSLGGQSAFKLIITTHKNMLPWWLRQWRIHLKCIRPRLDPWSQEGPLGKEMAYYSNILAWRILWTEEPGRLQFMVLQRAEYGWEINTYTHT